MKKIAVILSLVIGLCSCNHSTVTLVDNTTSVPSVVYSTADDSLVKPKYVVVETEDDIYLINKTVSKENRIEKSIRKNDGFALGFWFAIILVVIFQFVGWLLSDDE